MTKHDTPDNNRRRFFEAALDVWAEKGFHAARMDEIAARAGRSKGSLYHHFASKSELLVGFVEDLFGEVEDDLGAALEHASSATALITGITEEFAGRFENDPRMMRVFVELFSLSTREQDVHDLLARYYQRMIDAFERIFAWGVQRGEFRRDIDPAVLARTFAFAGDGAAIVDAVMGTGDLRRTLREVTALILRGAAAD